MARLLEHHAKALLSQAGIAVPGGEAATSPEEAFRASKTLGASVVVKALVPIGGKGKAGLVRRANTPEEAAQAATDLLGRTVSGYEVRQVLVESRVESGRELFAALTFDTLSRGPVVLASPGGGVSVEEAVAGATATLARRDVDVRRGLPRYQAVELCEELGLSGSALVSAADVLVRLSEVFRRADARVAEINPLVLTSRGEAVAVGVALVIDEEALHRHPEFRNIVEYTGERFWRPPNAREREVLEAMDQGAVRYIEMDGGEIANLVIGGGGSLLCFDLIERYGRRPAFYMDFSPGGSPEKVRVLYHVALSKPGLRGVLLAGNIYSLVRVDVMARAFVAALDDSGIDTARVPLVVRLAGPGEEAVPALFAGRPGAECYTDDVTLEWVCRRIVERVREQEGRA